jgi:hypothetical protein
MLVLTFRVGDRHNCVTVAGTPYVFARTVLGSFVLRARCAHRGGPLHLSQVDAARTRLICPWHGRGTSMTPLLRGRGVPVVRRGDRVTAVFAVPADTPHELGYRPLSPDLRATPPAPDGGRM